MAVEEVVSRSCSTTTRASVCGTHGADHTGRGASAGAGGMSSKCDL
jgi:hypothetical protein